MVVKENRKTKMRRKTGIWIENSCLKNRVLTRTKNCQERLVIALIMIKLCYNDRRLLDVCPLSWLDSCTSPKSASFQATNCSLGRRPRGTCGPRSPRIWSPGISRVLEQKVVRRIFCINVKSFAKAQRRPIKLSWGGH